MAPTKNVGIAESQKRESRDHVGFSPNRLLLGAEWSGCGKLSWPDINHCRTATTSGTSVGGMTPGRVMTTHIGRVSESKADVFMCIAIIITDGIINVLTIIVTSYIDFKHKLEENESGLSSYMKKHPSLNYDDRKRIEVFLENKIPLTVSVGAYIESATISSVVIPWLFDQIRFYHLAALYIIMPVIGFANTYATGLTDWISYIVAAWIVKAGAVVAGLVACGLVIAAIYISSQTTQDIKTVGVVIGSIVNPCIFLAFEKNEKPGVTIGSAQSHFPCPFAGLFRAIGEVGTRGVKELPAYCLAMCLAAFFITVFVDALTIASQRKGWRLHNYLPNMTVVALPFFAGPDFAIDIRSAELLSSAVAAGLISGEGLFALPSAILTMFSVQPPMCMRFFPSGKEVDVVDSFLHTLDAASKT
ncbi:hypothetical protein BRADI_2g31531v3 [Brachypodium distachyon]|uniref:Uncharacterized protein n=1 Tax=Brachypodium distachyon TaxID=15368 RepID=A0A0Q3G6C8_BRADI|nr:hypothetical protein BRADI_2g31531v3 [Brachypodium distachyon]